MVVVQFCWMSCLGHAWQQFLIIVHWHFIWIVNALFLSSRVWKVSVNSSINIVIACYGWLVAIYNTTPPPPSWSVLNQNNLYPVSTLFRFCFCNLKVNHKHQAWWLDGSNCLTRSRKNDLVQKLCCKPSVPKYCFNVSEGNKIASVFFRYSCDVHLAMSLCTKYELLSKSDSHCTKGDQTTLPQTTLDVEWDRWRPS